MVPEFIVNVDESDFEYEVLQYSTRVPVVVDFWATWCVPCRVLGPRLEALAREGEGNFRLAKVNVDENVRLAKQYKIRNIPAVTAFMGGHVVAEFSGVLEEDSLRDFVRRLSPAPEDLLYAKGINLLALDDYEGAEETFREFLSQRPFHSGAILGLVRALLMQGEGYEASVLLENFPASSDYHTAQFLKPVAEAFKHSGGEAVESDNPLEATFRNGVRLAQRGNILAAMDGFLDILRRDRHYRQDQVKDIFVGLLTLIGDRHPEARKYRNDLSTALF